MVRLEPVEQFSRQFRNSLQELLKRTRLQRMFNIFEYVWLAAAVAAELLEQRLEAEQLLRLVQRRLLVRLCFLLEAGQTLRHGPQ
jgi:hypothetical protein